MAQNARLCFEKNFRIEHAVRLHEEIVASGGTRKTYEDSCVQHPNPAQHEAVHE